MMLDFRKISLVVLALPLMVFVGCQKKLELVDADFKDPIRHYYPVVQGEQLRIFYEVDNPSEHPLFIREVQTTCGCIVPKDDLPIVVLPGKRNSIRLEFNSIKNTGHVEHYVWVYGNFVDSNYRELRFDTNVVPPADYTRDYETLWHEQHTKTGSMKDFVDGDASEKGYYTERGIDAREEDRLETQRKVDNYAF